MQERNVSCRSKWALNWSHDHDLFVCPVGQHFACELLSGQEYSSVGLGFWWLSQVYFCSRRQCDVCAVCAWHSPAVLCQQRCHHQALGCWYLSAHTNTQGKMVAMVDTGGGGGWCFPAQLHVVLKYKPSRMHALSHLRKCVCVCGIGGK